MNRLILSRLLLRMLLPILAVTSVPALAQAWVPTINKYSDINLGSLVPGASAGTLTLTAPSGTRTTTGGASLGSSAAVSLGTFTVLGKSGDPWSISASSAVPFTLTGPRGATLTVTAVDCKPATTGTFPAGGMTGYFYLGATLSAGTSVNTPAGTYTGSYALTVTDFFKGASTPMTFAVQVQVDPVITLSALTGLRFGEVYTGATPGTVMLSPSGAISTTGGAGLSSLSPTGPATFNVSGAANATYAISLPSSITLNATNGTLSISAITSSPSQTGLLNAMGQQTLSVGGTLNVPANQPEGDYAGTFYVTVAYN